MPSTFRIRPSIACEDFKGEPPSAAKLEEMKHATPRIIVHIAGKGSTHPKNRAVPTRPQGTNSTRHHRDGNSKMPVPHALYNVAGYRDTMETRCSRCQVSRLQESLPQLPEVTIGLLPACFLGREPSGQVPPDSLLEMPDEPPIRQ